MTDTHWSIEYTFTHLSKQGTRTFTQSYPDFTFQNHYYLLRSTTSDPSVWKPKVVVDVKTRATVLGQLLSPKIKTIHIYYIGGKGHRELVCKKENGKWIDYENKDGF